MNKYFVLFGIPAASIQEWMTNVDEETRKKQMGEMMQSWDKWMSDHADTVIDKGTALGKTKRATKDGVTDIKNEFNWYLLIQAESRDAAAELFVTHPHLQDIPGAYVEVMDANRTGEM